MVHTGQRKPWSEPLFCVDRGLEKPVKEGSIPSSSTASLCVAQRSTSAPPGRDHQGVMVGTVSPGDRARFMSAVTSVAFSCSERTT